MKLDISCSIALAFVCLLAGCAAPTIRFPSSPVAGSVMLSGYLYRPEGAGPFPAMVLLHTCGGLRRHVLDWGRWLKSEGYAALAVDSFSPRGTVNVCGRGGSPSAREVALDAFGALDYLRSLPFVDPERIGVMGWSYGATAALQASSELTIESLKPKGGGFRVAVAFYPDCDAFGYAPGIPVLLLLAEADDWTPPLLCVRYAEQFRRGGRTVLWKVYPGADHSFDEPAHGFAGIRYLGHTLKYDPAVTATAEKDLRTFLAQYLRGSRP